MKLLSFAPEGRLGYQVLIGPDSSQKGAAHGIA
ncbi:hypothetical protein Corgl_0608 [Coriobacterium glomerans PW2]|uniref:Uncharacterized protein n=1 Tax=Coriobacterium glomerans (strain ATCC 49209 / DSM 20642 / JCM 10262 / PW2) TaxID=700015 RepID=F2NBI6_CORGP|nr:hypothetical protein Corgl_0608 [Coriobacterium glomerans PW2]